MKILSLSADAELARLRAYALEHVGHEVVSVTGAREAVEIVGENRVFDVVLLCHTLTAATARQIVRLLQHNQAGASTIYIVHIYGEWPEVEADRYVVGADGPEAILNLLKELPPPQ